MADAAWTEEPIYKPIVGATDALKADGFDDDPIIDALVSIGLTWAQHRHGARYLSQRLYLMARQFAAEADAADGISRAHPYGSIN